MLDRLFDFVSQVWQHLVPWVVLAEYERGIILRLGRFHRELGPGLHWCIPFGVEECMYDNVVVDTFSLPPQSLTTADDVTIVVRANILWTISNLKTLMLGTESKEGVVYTTTQGAIAQYVAANEWADLGVEAWPEIAQLARDRAAPFGIEIQSVEIVDLSRSRSIRLWQPGS